MSMALRWGTMALLLGAMAGPAAAQSRAPAPEITLPEMLAVELPGPGVTELDPAASPLRELLAAAQWQGQPAAHNVTRPLRAGTTAVTWSATDASGRTVTRTEPLQVFPFGQTPVGVSRLERATGGNNAPKMARDAEGKVHMVWLDAGRPRTEPRVLYRRASTDPQTGAVTWEIPPLLVSSRATAAAGAFTALRVSPGAVHIAWQGPNESTRYRRLVRGGDGAWTPEPIRDTRAMGAQWDKGPGLDVRGDDEIHVVSATGRYSVSKNGGGSWTREALPAPPAGLIKGPALVLDAQGNSHVVYTATVRSPKEWTSNKPNRAFWELRYARRAADGTWVDHQNILAGQPGWAEPKDDNDVLADWPDIAVDGAGNVHVAWHGTANTHIFGRDEAFYARRPATGPGAWGAWEPPQLLFPRPAGSRGHYSFAPSLSVDGASDVVFALIFVDLAQNLDLRMDSLARVLRGGRLEGAPVPLATTAAAAIAQGRPELTLAAWFPMAAPRLHAAAGGRVWLDVLQTLVPVAETTPCYIVYQRVEVSALTTGRAR